MSRTALAAVFLRLCPLMSRITLATVFLYLSRPMSRMALATVVFPNDETHRDKLFDL